MRRVVLPILKELLFCVRWEPRKDFVQRRNEISLGC